ncbi:hypothetical protein Rsub_12746 [Raphidocelis subcapitata]|uniref:Uncharacterized protein n=1 Tax=Raphidocelis subcapitata TaxID=307507 RepID=A0A2V0PK09_9CHLO|nr:hypothetical protein Rsub_12746 [Raphidocelis subcapitata]|eukprot:GBG00135.1 hypothetical protein Rsub_12746 [Raphidocelis subcapitata]
MALACHQRAGAVRAPIGSRNQGRALRVVCSAQGQGEGQESRRQVLLKSVNVGVIAALFTWGAAPRPSNLGVIDYGGGARTLGLCPPTPNCISTAEELNDIGHYAPPLTYNPQDGRGSKGPATQAQAMDELAEAVANLKPDKFTPTIVKRTEDYLYAEYESPTFGFIDDVEFYFPAGDFSRVEYRSASTAPQSTFAPTPIAATRGTRSAAVPGTAFSRSSWGCACASGKSGSSRAPASAPGSAIAGSWQARRTGAPLPRPRAPAGSGSAALNGLRPRIDRAVVS